jgi:Icc protein
MSAPSTVLVQLSDPHVVAPGRLLAGRVDTPSLFAQAVAAVLALRPLPAAIVVSGDLVERGTAAEYRHLRALLAPLPGPVWLMPGNHDDRVALRQVFPDHAELAAPADGDAALAPFVLWERRLDGLRLLALDTVVPGASHGTLCARRLAWLDRRLRAEPSMPTLVAMHHPPFRTGIAHMDAMGLLKGSDALAALLLQHPQVERVICGHLHRPILRRYAGTLAMTVPSTAHQIVMDLDPAAPAAWRREPPGFAVHAWHDGALVTHFAAVGDFGPVETY